jgi:hypothetical protein
MREYLFGKMFNSVNCFTLPSKKAMPISIIPLQTVIGTRICYCPECSETVEPLKDKRKPNVNFFPFWSISFSVKELNYKNISRIKN